MPKFKKNPNSFMKKYNASGAKHVKPSPEKFFGAIRAFRGLMGRGNDDAQSTGAVDATDAMEQNQPTPGGFGSTSGFGAMSRFGGMGGGGFLRSLFGGRRR